jgi:dihydroorotase
MLQTANTVTCLNFTINYFMASIIIKQAQLVNEGTSKVCDVLIKNGRFERIDNNISVAEKCTEVSAEAKILMPGVIDDQVHFREPGLTHKATIGTEATAAVAGGTTTFMEMPNTIPNALTFELLEEKYAIGAKTSLANYSFFMGVSNDNAEEALKINQRKNEVCGLKIFMGSSTGNMLVDNYLTLGNVFRNSEVLIATHCEREEIVQRNQAEAIAQWGENMDATKHPIIRNTEACFESSYSAIQLAKQHDTRLHILHISTEKELQLFGNMLPLADKRITAEVCVHHLHFTADDYEKLGNQIKCNPAIKAKENKTALWQALLDDRLDIIATDHAPHTWDEKSASYLKAPAGVPLVQHSLQLMLDYVHSNSITIEKMVEKMCHAPAICFNIKDRGFIREGYYADAVLLDLNKPYTVSKENILHKCNWSPFEGHTFKSSIASTYVNGNLVWDGEKICTDISGMRIGFDR